MRLVSWHIRATLARMGHGGALDIDALRRHMEAYDGRLMTPREIAVALSLTERDARMLLGVARREGWVRTVGTSPAGASLYGFAAPLPPPAVDASAAV